VAIVLVTEEAIPPAQRFSLTERLATEIAAMDYPVYLVCVRGAGDWTYPGVTYAPVDMPGWTLFDLKMRLRANLQLCAQVLRLCHTEPVMLVYGWWPIVFFGRYMGRKSVAADMPEFIEEMYRSFGKPMLRIMGPLLKAYQTLVARSCRLVLTESDIARAVWCSRGVSYERTRAMPYGVETDRFAVARRGDFRQEYGIAENDVVVLFHGDIGTDDGVDILLQATHDLPVKVAIVGGGDPAYMRYLKSIAGPNVLFTGWIAYSRMSEVLATCDICVAPFRSTLYTNSTCPIKVMEAMAAGKATVMSNLHTLAQYVTDGHDCRLVEPGDVSHLQSTISDLADRYGERRRLGENARRTAAERFHWRVRVREEARLLIGLASTERCP